uniref:Uncharacterized protein n=1 Tax=Siphoviridae sp. cti6f5 TaxID=2826430 RepID=A0A8S5MDM7_9CAUD|nr:MAG TPA: hypothetical protein [Siphoviridae sp. cti6f5]
MFVLFIFFGIIKLNKEKGDLYAVHIIKCYFKSIFVYFNNFSNIYGFVFNCEIYNIYIKKRINS